MRGSHDIHSSLGLSCRKNTVPDFTLGGALAQAVLDDELTRAAVEEFESATARHLA